MAELDERQAQRLAFLRLIFPKRELGEPEAWPKWEVPPAPRKRGGGRRPRNEAKWEEMWGVVERYYRSGLSQSDFCQPHSWKGGGIRTLQRWIKELEQKDAARLAELRKKYGF